MSAFAAAVLCGGRSRRMGVDKATLVVDGERLVDRAVRLLGTIASPVIVAPGSVGRVPSLPDGVVEVADAMPDRGPLGGLVAALRASPHPYVAVMAVDAVDADARVFTWLFDHHAAGAHAGAHAVIPLDAGGRLQPLHALYAAHAADHLHAALAAADLALRLAIDGLDVRTVTPPPELGQAWARNLNHLGDDE